MTSSKSSAAGFVVNAFDALTPDLNQISLDSASYAHDGWVKHQMIIAGAAGAAAMAIPGAHMLALAADIGVLMNRMAVVSYGIGAIKMREQEYGSLEREDFALVLATWTGDFRPQSALDASVGVAAKMSAKMAIKVGGKTGAVLIANAMGNALGLLAGKKLGPKVAAKVGAKFASKLVAKGTAGWIPVLGAAMGAGVNSYFVQNIAVAARQYFDCKSSLIASAVVASVDDCAE